MSQPQVCNIHPENAGNASSRRQSYASIFTLIIAGLLSALPHTVQADDEKQPAVPQVISCSSRYERVASPAPPLNAANGKQAIRSGYGTRDAWGAKKNIEVLSPQQTGLGETGLRVHYPKGTSAPSDNGKGGAGFYATIDALSGAERACLQYKVRFEPGFDFVKGGKLPGLYGGKAPSGGDKVTGDGYSMRFMWREQGQGELYGYVVNMDSEYGESMGRGLWTFPTGQWVTIEQEIILNDPHGENGIARVWIDGRPILEQRGIVYRTQGNVFADGLMFSTFFGGSGEGWRTKQDQSADFADFNFYRYRK